MRIETGFTRVVDDFGPYIVRSSEVEYIAYVRTQRWRRVYPNIIPTPIEFVNWLWRVRLHIYWWQLEDWFYKVIRRG